MTLRKAPYDGEKVAQVRKYFSNLDDEVLADAFILHYAARGDQSEMTRKAMLAQLLPQLNERLKQEAEALLIFQKAIRAEDKANAQQRNLGRAFNAEQRQRERAVVLHNIELIQITPIPKGLSEEDFSKYRHLQECLLHRLDDALARQRTTGRLIARTPQPKAVIRPRRNHRREELTRRLEAIRELMLFCGLVERVVVGEQILDDDGLGDLVGRARMYLRTQERARVRAYKRGDYERARDYIKPAERHHYNMLYLKLKRCEERLDNREACRTDPEYRAAFDAFWAESNRLAVLQWERQDSADEARTRREVYKRRLRLAQGQSP